MNDLPIPFTIGNRYHVIKYISHGSQAIIYQAYDTQTKQLIALKRYKYFQEMDEKSQKEAISEYEVLQKINNKNIMRCFDVIQEGQDLFIVAELLNGITLENFVSEQFKQCPVPQISYDKLIKLLEPYDTNKQNKFQTLIQPVFKQYWNNMQNFKFNNDILQLLAKANNQFNQELFSKLDKDNVQSTSRNNMVQQDSQDSSQYDKSSSVQHKQEQMIASMDDKPSQQSTDKELRQHKQQNKNIYVTPATTKPPSRSSTPKAQIKQMNQMIQQSQEKFYRKQLAITQNAFGNTLQYRYSNLIYENVVIDLCKQLLNMLKCLQQNKLIHRDVCPNNIMVIVDEKGKLQLKLIDFGLCRSMDEHETTIAGTPGFLRPDFYNLILTGQGRSQTSQAIDIWSFGAVAYYMLHGYPPVPSPKTLIARRFYAAEALELPINQTISASLKNFLNLSLHQAKPNIRTLFRALQQKQFNLKLSNGSRMHFRPMGLFSSCKMEKITLNVIIMSINCELPSLKIQNNRSFRHNGKLVNIDFNIINDISVLPSQNLQSANVLVIFFSNVAGFQHIQKIHTEVQKNMFKGKFLQVYTPIQTIDYKLAEVADLTWNTRTVELCHQNSINVLKQQICNVHFNDNKC